MSPEALLERCLGPSGYVAAQEGPSEDYGRVWARDACICGLSVYWTTGEVEGLERSLRTLLGKTGPAGQVPSNVGSSVSYGSRSGRVDATLWAMVALRELGRDNSSFGPLLRAWEFNANGRIVTPEGGNWADEYPIGGETLYDNALRSRAEDTPLRGFRGLPAALTPAGPDERFDAFGVALCVLWSLGRKQDREAAFERGLALRRHGLVPAFDPVITQADPRWSRIEGLAVHELRNLPGRYHNGGLWPVVNGFWARAARAIHRHDIADELLAAIQAANAHGYPEYLDANTGEPGGALSQAWSAAGELLAQLRA